MGEFRFEVLAQCNQTRARASTLHLAHGPVKLPVFMPVGTRGTIKGLTCLQLQNMGCEILLGNTYHLGHSPGPRVLELHGGLHKFMNWERAILTDSGGFQMVSLLKLSKIDEQGVIFDSPKDGTRMLLTPEESIRLQHSIGGDIIMQLDDVVNPLSSSQRLDEAMQRSIRWLGRCIQEHGTQPQNLFAIVQGGLDLERRRICIEAMAQMNTPGYAIGGLGGGEDKESFCEMIGFCTLMFPTDKPVYCMGIGYDVDIVLSVALGVDMFDCVFPTRTARFGHALTKKGQLSLKNRKFEYDMSPIDSTCPCVTCRHYSRAYLHAIVTKETVACHYLTIHNLTYMFGLMASIRLHIEQGQFPQFIQDFVHSRYPDCLPHWIQTVLTRFDLIP